MGYDENSKERPLKWPRELTQEELKTYPLNRIKVGYARLENEWITADQIYSVNLPKSEVKWVE